MSRLMAALAALSLMGALWPWSPDAPAQTALDLPAAPLPAGGGPAFVPAVPVTPPPAVVGSS